MPAGSRSPRRSAWSDYLRAVVDIELPGGTVRIAPGAARNAVPLPAHPLSGGRTIHIITAFNPYGTTIDTRVNLEAQDRLREQIDRLRLLWWPAVGGDPLGTHAEVSVAVVGLSDPQARTLGARFGQDAVFAWRSTACRLLACSPARSVTPPAQASRVPEYLASIRSA